MSARFDAFVIFAEMRTGSNHLEESLNALDGVESFGEAFNQAFLGAPNRTELLGFDKAARQADPEPLLRAILAQPGLTGLRFFHDHDPRVLDAILNDPRIAKVVLTRNPLDSYVSLEIAARTGQWRLTNAKMAKTATMRFDGADFDRMLADQRAFRDFVQRRLQVTGQTAFWIGYDDIGDLEVLNGLAAFLGAAGRLSEIPDRLKRQNPGEIEEKVENPAEMHAHLAGLDPFVLGGSAPSEPSRGAAVPKLMVAAESAVIAMPIPGNPAQPLRDWLGRLDAAAPREGLSQKELRPWMRRHPGFVSFAILRHPLVRAYDAFCRAKAGKGPKWKTLRRVLANQHSVDFEGGESAAFLAFLTFLRANLGGQSALPVAPDWATQTAVLAGMAQVVLPQRLIRETEAQAELDRLAGMAGRAAVLFEAKDARMLARIVTPEIEEACAAAYRRDFVTLGFGPWAPGQAASDSVPSVRSV